MSGNTQRKKRVRLEFTASPKSEVFVAGSFNDWNPVQTKLKDKTGSGTYRAALLLPHGRYEYKFVVNGKWVTDPQNQNTTLNGYGEKNSVVNVA